MENFQKFLGAAVLYTAAIAGVSVGRWSASLETRHGLADAAPWLMPTAMVAFGWILAGILWKAVIELGLPRFFLWGPRWMILPLPAVILMAAAVYGVAIFLPALSRLEMLMMLPVIPLIPAYHSAWLRLRRELDEELEEYEVY